MVDFKSTDSGPEQLFLIDALDVAIKDDLVSMEHPIYSLSKKPIKKEQLYEYKDVTIEFRPSSKGFPTIYDKDLIIFAVSHLVNSLEEGQTNIPNVVEFDPNEYFKFTKRKIGGNSYKILLDSIDRLKESYFRTNIKINGIIEDDWIGIVNDVKLQTDMKTGKLLKLRMELSSTIISTIRRREVLTLNKRYFELTKPIERRLYELARKHCGHQPKWAPYLKTLHIKSGSKSTLREFRRTVRSVVDENELPDYNIYYEKEDDQVFFYPREKFTQAYIQNESKSFNLPTWAYEKARQFLPKNIDVYMAESDWIKCWEKNGKEEIKNPVGAFINYCKIIGGYRDKPKKNIDNEDDLPLNTSDINLLEIDPKYDGIDKNNEKQPEDKERPSLTANYFNDKGSTEELINLGYTWDGELGDFVPPEVLSDLAKKCPRIGIPPTQKIFMKELIEQGYVWDDLIFGYRKVK